ncbi:hypothetical protein ABW19_dt0204268 [Dactylella cylindrospora]|nr:hypothetical protein ABW19_dt0204268 [Dactylella cylindrospora]
MQRPKTLTQQNKFHFPPYGNRKMRDTNENHNCGSDATSSPTSYLPPFTTPSLLLGTASSKHRSHSSTSLNFFLICSTSCFSFLLNPTSTASANFILPASKLPPTRPFAGVSFSLFDTPESWRRGLPYVLRGFVDSGAADAARPFPFPPLAPLLGGDGGVGGAPTDDERADESTYISLPSSSSDIMSFPAPKSGLAGVSIACSSSSSSISLVTSMRAERGFEDTFPFSFVDGFVALALVLAFSFAFVLLFGRRDCKDFVVGCFGSGCLGFSVLALFLRGLDGAGCSCSPSSSSSCSSPDSCSSSSSSSSESSYCMTFDRPNFLTPGDLSGLEE